MNTENRSQEERPTLSALKAAADAIPSSPADECPFGLHMSMYQAECTRYHSARAEFWRLAFKWRDQGGAPIVSSGRDETGQEARDAIRDDREADAIISEVESRE